MAKTSQPTTDLQRLTSIRTVRPAVALPSAPQVLKQLYSDSLEPTMTAFESSFDRRADTLTRIKNLMARARVVDGRYDAAMRRFAPSVRDGRGVGAATALGIMLGGVTTSELNRKPYAEEHLRTLELLRQVKDHPDYTYDQEAYDELGLANTELGGIVDEIAAEDLAEIADTAAHKANRKAFDTAYTAFRQTARAVLGEDGARAFIPEFITTPKAKDAEDGGDVDSGVEDAG
jgi:hypothetical protein